MSEQSDISRILFTIFDGIETLGIPKADVVRLWSLEMQWFSPEESERVVKALTEAGWILQEEGALHLTEGVELEIPSLGWRPMTRRMLSPPPYKTSAKEVSKDLTSDFSQPKVSTREEKNNEPKNGQNFSRPNVGRSSENPVSYTHLTLPTTPYV